MNCSTPGLPVHHQHPESTQTHVHWVSDAIQPSHPLWSPSPPALNLSQHQSFQMSQLFASGGQRKYWSFSFSISLSKDYSGLISFRIHWLISLLSKGLSTVSSSTTIQKEGSILCSAFFMVQLSHLYITTGKTMALTVQTFVGKMMSLLFNTLSRFFIAFFPRSKHFLISLLKSPSAVILEPKKRKSVIVNTFPPSIWYEVMGLDAMILVFWMLSFKPAF